MSTSSLPGFLDALKDALEDRAGLDGVNIFTGPVLPEQLGEKAIELAAEVDIEQSRAAMGSTDIEETYEVPGSIVVYSANPDIEEAAKDARDAAAAILEELTDELSTNDDMDDAVRDVRIASQRWRQGPAPEGQLGRICWVEFRLAVQAHITP